MKKAIFLFQIISVFVLSPVSGQSYHDLVKLKGYDLPVYVSPGHETFGHTTAQLTEGAIKYMVDKVAGFTPEITILILSPNDWPTYANMPVIYGMPHNGSNNTLILSAEDNPFWQSQIPPVDLVPENLREQYLKTFTTENGSLSGQAFFNLLIVHELGHAFYNQGGLKEQSFWLSEIFCNLFMHSYIAENEPSLLDVIEILPKVVIGMGHEEFEYTTLDQFEASYETIARTAPKNYGWYQLGFKIIAKNIYEAGGLEAFKSLWDALKNEQKSLNSEELLAMLQSQVHPTITHMLENWNK